MFAPAFAAGVDFDAWFATRYVTWTLVAPDHCTARTPLTCPDRRRNTAIHGAGIRHSARRDGYRRLGYYLLDSPINETSFMTQRYDLVIAGGGPSGSAAAWQAAQTGAKVSSWTRPNSPATSPAATG